MSATKKTKPRKTAYHHGDLRRALMDEGLKVISREGASRLNLRELARAVGVSHGAPYRHFESREELILELALEGATIFLRFLEEGRDEGGTDIQRRFRGMGVGYFHFAIRHPHHYRLIFNREVPPDLVGPQAEELGKTMQGSFMALMEMVQDMQKAGHIRKDDPFVISSVIWSHLHGIVSLLIDGRFQGLGGEGIPGKGLLCPETYGTAPAAQASVQAEREAQAFFDTLMSYVMTGIGAPPNS